MTATGNQLIVTITGDRNWYDYQAVSTALRTLDLDTAFVVLGDARGADRLARWACEDIGLAHKVFRADWDRYKNGAGHIRNGEMLDYHQKLVATLDLEGQVWYFHDNLTQSKGTANCVMQARARGLTVCNGRNIR